MMNKSANKLIYLFFIISVFFSTGCGQNQKAEQTAKNSAQGIKQEFDQVQIQHATGFRITYHEGYKIVEVTKPWKNAQTTFKYLLLPHGITPPAHDEHTTVVRIPVQKAVATSTTHLPAFDLLQASDVLRGFPNTDYISSPQIRQQVEAGNLQDLGPENSINMEMLIGLQPDMIMSYGMGGQNSGLEKFKRTGLPVVVNADYMETTPLGQAEWIKFTAAFLNKEKEAQQVFEKIEARYDSLKALANQANSKPTVYSGIVYGDTWYMPSGESWAGRILKDAHAHYLWQDTQDNGSLELSFEAVYAKAHDADFWLNTGAFESLKNLADFDSRYTEFKAFQKGQVYNNNAKIGAKGGHVYLELGCARPDFVLADLIKILHPELMPDYELYFYQKLD
jgi:iron complex transport system substrate-binding protein